MPNELNKKKIKELKKKYKNYSKELKKLEKNNKGKTPELGTPEGNLIYRYTQTINVIEKLAEKHGIKINKK